MVTPVGLLWSFCEYHQRNQILKRLSGDNRGLIMRRTKLVLVWLLVLIVLPALSWAWQGKVVGVSDGDTITVLHEGKGEKIRLYGVDCPESHQDFGQKAKQFTSDQVFGKVVEVKPVDTDRYGRTVGLVTVDGKSLNEDLVKSGLAWVYTQYCRESFCSRWSHNQEEARTAKMGLWSIPNPTPPWEFRHPTKSDQPKNQARSRTESNQQEVLYHGNRSSKVFHRQGCQHFDCKAQRSFTRGKKPLLAIDRAEFVSREAITRGSNHLNSSVL